LVRPTTRSPTPTIEVFAKVRGSTPKNDHAVSMPLVHAIKALQMITAVVAMIPLHI
jgi:hypothetical protein